MSDLVDELLSNLLCGEAKPRVPMDLNEVIADLIMFSVSPDLYTAPGDPNSDEAIRLYHRYLGVKDELHSYMPTLHVDDFNTAETATFLLDQFQKRVALGVTP